VREGASSGAGPESHLTMTERGDCVAVDTMMQSRRTFLGSVAATVAAVGCGAEATRDATFGEPTEPVDSDDTQVIVTAQGATLDHPLLQRLHEVDRYIREHFTLPQYADEGVGAVGLILSQTLENGGYWCSPRNGLEFARTGGDGDHYSLLIQDGAIDESSPVVLTQPPEGANIVVGESLHDFLCFGMHGGYFSVLYGHLDPPTVKADGLRFHSHVEEYEQQVIAMLAGELKLTPWPQAARASRFDSLQDRFRPLVDAPMNPG
jgi:hypothetical protein